MGKGRRVCRLEKVDINMSVYSSKKGPFLYDRDSGEYVDINTIPLSISVDYPTQCYRFKMKGKTDIVLPMDVMENDGRWSDIGLEVIMAVRKAWFTGDYEDLKAVFQRHVPKEVHEDVWNTYQDMFGGPGKGPSASQKSLEECEAMNQVWKST